VGLHRLALLDEDLTRHEDDHTGGPGVIGGHAVVVSKYLRPSAHEPSSMGQPRELRGDRRRHTSSVKRLTQAKTTGSLIQRLSLRHGYNECRACQDERGEINRSAAPDCSTRNMDRRIHVDPGASWRALTGQQMWAQTSSRAERHPPSLTRASSGVRDASNALSLYTLGTRSWTTGQAFPMRRTTWAQIRPNEFGARSHSGPHPPPQPLNRSSGSQDTTSPPIWGSRGREFKSRQPDPVCSRQGQSPPARQAADLAGVSREFHTTPARAAPSPVAADRAPFQVRGRYVA
jgi:hypothetical protein